MEIESIQAIELKIFKEIKKVCDQNNIHYILIGGSLLGAIRHKGFIPWDDDIDIGMSRDNFNRFLEIASAQLSYPYFLQSFETDKNYPLSYAKVIDTSTSFKESRIHNDQSVTGFFVDIFPFDRMPENRFLRFKQLYQYKLVNSEIEMKLGWRKSEGKNKLVSFYYNKFQRNTTISELINQRDSIMQKYLFDTKLDYFNISSQYGPDRERITNLEMNRTCNVIFENISVSIPREYDEILTRQYGDYMTLPKDKQRYAKHMVN